MREIFVFASNLLGAHGGGSAAHAYHELGAVWGQAFGLQGDSYAIPTLDCNYGKLPLEKIGYYVEKFFDFASDHPDWTFNVVAVGCGIAGFSAEEIAPMFADAPDNCKLPSEFMGVLDGLAA